jgi:hypothetical protein
MVSLHPTNAIAKLRLTLPPEARTATIAPVNNWPQDVVCEVFFWRYAISLFTVTYEPYKKGD